MIPALNHTPYFKRMPVTEQSAPQNITAAYQAAGLNPPNLATAAVERALAAPDVEAVALELAQTAFTTDDADAWHADALDTLTRAQAAVKLRDTLRAKWAPASRAHVEDMRRQAAADLAPVFKKAARQLARDVPKLPEGRDRFNTAPIIESEAATEFKRTREALALLGKIASAWPVSALDADMPGRWNMLVHVVKIPKITRERVMRMTNTPQNQAQAVHAYAAREIGRTAERLSLDHALADIAAGKHEGFTLELADADELQERRRRLRDAYTRDVVEDGDTEN